MTRFTPPAVLLALLFSAAHSTADDAVPKADDLFQTLDADGDGTLTKDEIGEDQQKAFNRLLRVGDANDDGQLTKDEYTTALRPESKVKNDPAGELAKPSREGQPGFNVDRLFERIDRNSDGKIALDEVPEPLKPRLQPLFDRLEKDELTRADFEKMGRFMAGRPGPGMRPDGQRPPIALIQLLDADGNGMLSQEELSKLADKFSELDRDGDGQLAPRELLGFGGPPMPPGGKPNPKRPDGKKPKSTKADKPDTVETPPAKP